MFTPDEIREIIEKTEFRSDYYIVKQNLLNNQLRQDYQFPASIINRLAYFIETVLASSIIWEIESNRDIFKIGGEICEILSEYALNDYQTRKKFKFRGIMLYELAGYPALSSAMSDNGYYQGLLDFFKRKNLFGKLGFEDDIAYDNKKFSSFEVALSHDSYHLGLFEQGQIDAIRDFISDNLIEIAENIKLDYSATDVKALKKIIQYRLELSTRNNVSKNLFESLKTISFPTELWPSQKEAIGTGILDESIDSWGMAAPTGTGKTFLTRLLVLSTIRRNNSAKVLYIVPSKALVYEVSKEFQKAFSKLEIETMAVSSQLTSLDDENIEEFNEATILVITPEKADLLLRISKKLLDEVSLVIIDEAHHIEADTRGVLLELYLWRLKKLIGGKARFIFLSAVAPNISDLTAWIGTNPQSLLYEERANRMRAGVFEVKSEGRQKVGKISYTDGTSIEIISSNVQKTNRKLLVQLCEKLKVHGPILVVAKGKKECENLAEEMKNWLLEIKKTKKLSSAEIGSENIKRLDSRLEREMYKDVPLRKHIKHRIAYHHAGLPPRIRHSLEDAIKEGYIDFVFATTTLAEGVNFPFSCVIIQSIALRLPPGADSERLYVPITPRNFWNIAGRAGRPGFDKEGQVILFQPTLGLNKVNAVIGDYLDPNIKNINPVKSALSNSIIEIKNNIEENKITAKQIEKIELDEEVSKKIKGSINLIRVGLVHAEAEKILKSPEELIENSFANIFFNEEERKFAKDLINTQYKLIESFFKDPGSPSKEAVAGLGLSLDTLARLKNYITSLEDWKIENFSKLFYGSEVNFDQAPYIIGPVAKRMAELEGPTLGGFFSDLIINWLSGIPLSNVRRKTKNFREKSLEDLISVIYSRIQYLLPWGLFATDILIEEETNKRQIEYNNEVGKLSYLIDGGVPSFDSLRLVNLEFERVDATRLYFRFKSEGGKRKGMDIFGWIKSKSIDELEAIVKGKDNRSIDYDFKRLIKEL